MHRHDAEFCGYGECVHISGSQSEGHGIRLQLGGASGLVYTTERRPRRAGFTAPVPEVSRDWVGSLRAHPEIMDLTALPSARYLGSLGMLAISRFYDRLNAWHV